MNKDCILFSFKYLLQLMLYMLHILVDGDLLIANIGGDRHGQHHVVMEFALAGCGTHITH